MRDSSAIALERRESRCGAFGGDGSGVLRKNFIGSFVFGSREGSHNSGDSPPDEQAAREPRPLGNYNSARVMELDHFLGSEFPWSLEEALEAAPAAAPEPA